MSPGKRKAPVDAGADADTKTNQPSIKIVETKYAGKVRPICREPEVSWYR
jgi:hypothetical protein